MKKCENCKTLEKEIENYEYRLKCEHDLRIQEIAQMKLEFITRRPPDKLVNALLGLNRVWNYLVQIEMPKIVFTDEQKEVIEQSGILQNHPLLTEDELRELYFDQLGKDKWWLGEQKRLRDLRNSRDG